MAYFIEQRDITCGTVDDYGRELKLNRYSPKSMATGTTKALYGVGAAYSIADLVPLP